MSGAGPRIVVTGAGAIVLPGPETCDPTPWLRERKSRKYMGLQDEMAVVAAGRAIDAAGLRAPLGEGAGLYVSVGYIPFEEKDARPVLEGSLDARGAFSMERFAADGWRRAHPLLTFRCLPNMPAYHVSANLGVEGPYVVGYPGPAQTYLALEEAVAALESGAIQLALWGGVAYQRNFLVEHHLARTAPSLSPSAIQDGAGFAVLEREETAAARGAKVLAELEDVELGYEPFDPRVAFPVPDLGPPGLGAAGPPAALSSALGRAARFVHTARTRDGFSLECAWRIA